MVLVMGHRNKMGWWGQRCHCWQQHCHWCHLCNFCSFPMHYQLPPQHQFFNWGPSFHYYCYLMDKTVIGKTMRVGCAGRNGPMKRTRRMFHVRNTSDENNGSDETFENDGRVGEFIVLQFPFPQALHHTLDYALNNALDNALNHDIRQPLLEQLKHLHHIHCIIGLICHGICHTTHCPISPHWLPHWPTHSMPHSLLYCCCFSHPAYPV